LCRPGRSLIDEFIRASHVGNTGRIGNAGTFGNAGRNSPTIGVDGPIWCTGPVPSADVTRRGDDNVRIRYRETTDIPSRPGDPYGRDVLSARKPRRLVPEHAATQDLVVEDSDSGFCGAVVACTSTAVTLEDRRGQRRLFPLEPARFLIDGEPVTLVRPAQAAAAPGLSASGSRSVAGLRARTARAARIWVEGIHDAALIERVWGHDLRVEGIVVEPIDGLDNLPGAVAAFRPGPQRRLGVLADHLVAGSKESRIAATVTSPHVLVAGHPYIDVWEAVRPRSVGIKAWPTVPRGVDWKTGVCAALGISDTSVMWGRVNGAVSSYRDLATPLITAVETLIDFVTVE
jgi:hypothetical protein